MFCHGSNNGQRLNKLDLTEYSNEMTTTQLETDSVLYLVTYSIVFLSFICIGTSSWIHVDT